MPKDICLIAIGAACVYLGAENAILGILGGFLVIAGLFGDYDD